MSIIVKQDDHIKMLLIRKFNLVEDVKYTIVEKLISLCHRIDYRHIMLIRHLNFMDDIQYMIMSNFISLIK